MPVATQEHSVLYIRDMCCADEQEVVERKLRSLDGVGEHRYNLVARKLYVSHALPLDKIVSALRDVGFSAETFSRKPVSRSSFLSRHRDAVVASVAGFATLAGIVMHATNVGSRFSIPVLAIAIIVGGWKIAAKGWKAASVFALDMNALMSIAVVGAIAIGKWEEAAAVVVLFALAQFLEDISLRRTRKAISSLLELAPATATVRRGPAEIITPVEDVELGDIVIIRPGEKIPVDGKVLTGSSFVNQAAITGESVAIEKSAGAFVFAGSINERGSLEIETTKIGQDTTLGHIVHLVEEAQSQRSPSQDFVDRFARLYTPAVIALALLVALVPPLIFAQGFAIWFYRALVLLVIACPCALVISTPVTIVSGLTAAARAGILIKGGRYLEEAAKLKAVLFDKTGTLTRGISTVTDIIQLNPIPSMDILRIAALGELRSEHPIGRAIIEKAREQLIDLNAPIEKFEAIPGRGIVLQLEGLMYSVGSHQLVEERGLCSPTVEAHLDKLEAEGKTVVVVSSQAEVLGIIGVADSIRSESENAIQALRDRGIGEIIMLSGDSTAIARTTATSLRLDRHFGELLPAEKVALVKEMRSKHGSVAMVGDGVNDAPALAAASIGIAMGGTGTDVAMETADVVLMKDDLTKISTMISIGTKTMKILKQNVTTAIGVKALFLLLAVLGAANLWTAVIADDGVTLLVVLNSLRLLRKQ